MGKMGRSELTLHHPPIPPIPPNSVHHRMLGIAEIQAVPPRTDTPFPTSAKVPRQSSTQPTSASVRRTAHDQRDIRPEKRVRGNWREVP